jgi:hypothetical protein
LVRHCVDISDHLLGDGAAKGEAGSDVAAEVDAGPKPRFAGLIGLPG